MSKVPIRRVRKAPVVKQADDASLSGAVSLTTIDLFRAELKFRAAEPQSTVERGDVEYRCVIPIFRLGPSSDIIIVNFMISRSQSRVGGEDVDISYVCVFRRAETSHTEGQLRSFYEHFIKNTVWQKGRDLVLTFVSQGNLDLGPLPVVIPSVEWKTNYDKPSGM